MQTLKVGYSKINITPPMGIGIMGYFIPRQADGVLDHLEAVAVAVNHGDTTALLVTVDNCGIIQEVSKYYREYITEKTGVPGENIFIQATHTHTGPFVALDSKDELISRYSEDLKYKLADVCAFALADLKPAKMGIANSKADKISFIRRYRMKDGSAQTNPGLNNPDVVAPIGNIDNTVGVIRFDRKNATSIVMIHFANHPDSIGGNKISADWPGLTRRIFKNAVDNTECIVFNGAQGDVNHINPNPKDGDLNGMKVDFDGVVRGYQHAIHLGRVLTGSAMQVYDKVEYVDVDKISCVQKVISLASNMPDDDEKLKVAHEYVQLHNSGRDDLIPYKDMMLTTVVAESLRMVRLENGPKEFTMPLSMIVIGEVAIFGIPGEPFTEVGRMMREDSGYKMVWSCCDANGKEGYFPTMDAYLEGGYEARTSNFKAGVAETIVQQGKNILKGIKG